MLAPVLPVAPLPLDVGGGDTPLLGLGLVPNHFKALFMTGTCCGFVETNKINYLGMPALLAGFFNLECRVAMKLGSSCTNKQ
jgi:hypothetical protein